MADELIENAEFGRKRKNEEEPILVAQRFLNIYRQMHIFNKERQNQFDDMLLELSPDVRILLSTLPGGSLLLEHIEELEQKRGLVSAPIKKENQSESRDRHQYGCCQIGHLMRQETVRDTRIVVNDFADAAAGSRVKESKWHADDTAYGLFAQVRFHSEGCQM